MSDWHYPGILPEEDKTNPCDGCHECGLRCTSGIQMTQQEFARIIAHLKDVDPKRALRIFEQNKQVLWFEEFFYEACLCYDVLHRECLIYPVRPLICRLFGRVAWLPCPLEKPLPLHPRGLQILQIYAAEKRATFPEWCAFHGIFDPRRIFEE